MKKKRKTAGSVGVVLQKANDPGSLRQWAEYLAGEQPWKTLEIGAEKLLARWSEAQYKWQIFSAATPKASKMAGFEHEHGLVVFNTEEAELTIREKFKDNIPEGVTRGGYVAVLAAKTRHKGIGKYLLSAAERVISEKSDRVYLFVTDFNTSALRFYKSMGYEEIGRVSGVFKPDSSEILMSKKLST